MIYGLRYLAVLVSIAVLCFAPPPPPPPPPHGGPTVDEIRSKLANLKPSGKTGKELVLLSQSYLARSEQKAQTGDRFAADRNRAAADAFFRAADHLEHVSKFQGDRPEKKKPHGPEVSRHLERVYFRLKQCDFFLVQSGETKLKPVCGIARDLYQSGLRSQDEENTRAADEYAKAADDLTHAVEFLAQAAQSPERQP